MTSVPLLLLCDHRGDRPDVFRERLALAGHRVLVTRNLRESLAALEREQPAVVVVRPLSATGDAELRGLDRARAGDPPVPLLVLTDRKAPSVTVRAARALGCGAWDLAYEDAPPEELCLRLERLEAEARRLVEMGELRHRASHDDRTDLLRARAFEARVREHVSAAQRHRFDLALIVMDLDAFGAVNKQHDHTVGDSIIAQVGEVIRRALRAEDVAGRLGGDEFGVLLPYTRKVDAARVVERLRAEIHALSGHVAGAGPDLVVSASLGFETFDGSDLDNVGVLRAHAERALRVAKERGGNQAVYYRFLSEDPGRGAPAGTPSGTPPDA